MRESNIAIDKLVGKEYFGIKASTPSGGFALLSSALKV